MDGNKPVIKYLKVKKDSSRKKRHNSKGNSITTKKSKILKYDNELPIKNDYIDLNLACDFLFQYLQENKYLNQRYFNINLVITYITLIIINLFTLIFLTFTRAPHFAYKYDCYEYSLQSYVTCTYRSWCMCEIKERCLLICYEDELNCVKYFNDKMIEYRRSSDLSTFSQTILIRYENGNSKTNVFNRINTESCFVKNWIIIFKLSFFSGGMIGCLLFGFLSDKYGKKIIIISESIIIQINLIFMAVYSNKDFTQYDSINIFLLIWGMNGFISGSCLLSLEYIIYIQFMESYPDVNKLNTINGFLHSNFAFSGLFLIIFNNFVQNFSYFFYFSFFYFLFFLWFMILVQVENPRYFSEKKDYLLKKVSFERYVTKTLIQKKQGDGSEVKYWRMPIFYDSNRQKVINDVVIDKLIESTEKEIDEIFKIRNKERISREINKNDFTLLRKKIKKILPQNFLNENEQSKRSSIHNRISFLNNSNINKTIQNSSILPLQNKKEVNIMIKSVPNIVSNLPKISTKFIYNTFLADEYLKQYFWVFLVVWMSLSFCFYGCIFDLLFSVLDPNKDENYRNVGFLFYSIFMVFLMPILAGKISFYMSPGKILFFTLLISSVIAMTIDTPNISVGLERNTFFGFNFNFLKGSATPYTKSTCLIFVIIVYSIFELKTTTSTPTLYRTFFHSVLKSSSKITILCSYLNVTIMDSPNISLGIIGLFTCFIFLMVDIKWKDFKLSEYSDKHQTCKKREFNKCSDMEKKRSSSTIFTRLRNFSAKKMKKS